MNGRGGDSFFKGITKQFGASVVVPQAYQDIKNTPYIWESISPKQVKTKTVNYVGGAPSSKMRDQSTQKGNLQFNQDGNIEMIISPRSNERAYPKNLKKDRSKFFISNKPG